MYNSIYSHKSIKKYTFVTYDIAPEVCMYVEHGGGYEGQLCGRVYDMISHSTSIAPFHVTKVKYGGNGHIRGCGNYRR